MKSLEDFHEKIFHFGKTVIIGSANISKNSRKNLIEIITVSNDEKYSSDALKAFYELYDIAVEIDRDFIKLSMPIAVTKTSRMKKEIDNECKFVLYTLPSITAEKHF